ncbi:MAG: AtpZ/AtpI family protein [Polyangiaceae bacterium]
MQYHWKGVGTYGTVGLELVLSIVFGLWVGNKADQWLGTGPWLALLGCGFGVAAGVRSVTRALERANREAEKAEREEREARRRYLNDPGRKNRNDR